VFQKSVWVQCIFVTDKTPISRDYFGWDFLLYPSTDDICVISVSIWQIILEYAEIC